MSADTPLSDLERFEIIAHAFHSMTGYMAPGKDAGVMGDHRPHEERMRRYDEWWEKNGMCVKAMLRAFEEVVR